MSEQVTEHLAPAPPTPEDSAAALELLFGCLALGRSFNDMMPVFVSFKPENPTEIGNYPADASYTIIGTWTDPQTGAKLGQRHAGDTLLATVPIEVQRDITIPNSPWDTVTAPTSKELGAVPTLLGRLGVEGEPPVAQIAAWQDLLDRAEPDKRYETIDISLNLPLRQPPEAETAKPQIVVVRMTAYDWGNEFSIAMRRTEAHPPIRVQTEGGFPSPLRQSPWTSIFLTRPGKGGSPAIDSSKGHSSKSVRKFTQTGHRILDIATRRLAA